MVGEEVANRIITEKSQHVISWTAHKHHCKAGSKQSYIVGIRISSTVSLSYFVLSSSVYYLQGTLLVYILLILKKSLLIKFGP